MKNVFVISCLSSLLLLPNLAYSAKGKKPPLRRHAYDKAHKKHHKKTEQKAKHVEEAPVNPLSGYFILASNYIFRGLTQTQNLPAAQGGLTLLSKQGFYLSTFGSNVKFNDGRYSMLELDTGGGWRHSLFNDKLGVDLSYVRYNYPGDHFLNYNEFIGVFTYSFLQGTVGYSSNVYNVGQSGTYLNGGVNYNLPENNFLKLKDVKIQALTGHYFLPLAAGFSYSDYLVSIAKTYKIYTIAVTWTGTDGEAQLAPYDKSQVMIAFTASF